MSAPLVKPKRRLFGQGGADGGETSQNMTFPTAFLFLKTKPENGSRAREKIYKLRGSSCHPFARTALPYLVTFPAFSWNNNNKAQ